MEPNRKQETQMLLRQLALS